MSDAEPAMSDAEPAMSGANHRALLSGPGSQSDSFHSDRGSQSNMDPLLPRTLGAWVKAGLLQFRRAALTDDDVIVPLLQAQICNQLQSHQAPDWEHCCAAAEARFQHLARHHPLARMRDDLNLSAADLFLLALLGELETCHSVNLVIREFQQPDSSPRLSLHLAAALLEYLFPTLCDSGRFVPGFLSHVLLEQHFIECSDESTLPLAKLRISPVLYALLCGEDVLWPGCEWLLPEQAGTMSVASKADARDTASLIRAGSVPCRHTTSAGVVVRGVPGSGRRAFTRQLADNLLLRPVLVETQLWAQKTPLSALCRYAGWLPVLQPELGAGENFHMHDQLRQRTTPVAVILGIDGAVEGESLLEVQMQLPDERERQQQWQKILGNNELAADLARSILLSLNNIRAIAESAHELAHRKADNPIEKQHIYLARRHLGAEKLRLLAEPVNCQLRRDAMSFAGGVQEGIELLLMRARQRESLWRNLGVTLQATPNPGLRALFVGESGTGKTLAASLVASELAAPLYRVDLAAVMNKYIGESEKNLSQLLDHAAANDVVLLFDEADSLFGARTEGRETGERYANMLTNFLLSRIENHPGIVILTTNGSERIDSAFSRRIDVQIEFPLPAFEQRLQLWRCHLGTDSIEEKICASVASHCDFNGGQVRNAVLAAASYADGGPINTQDLLRGIRLEYGKLGRSVPRSIEQLSEVPGN